MKLTIDLEALAATLVREDHRPAWWFTGDLTEGERVFRANVTIEREKQYSKYYVLSYYSAPRSHTGVTADTREDAYRSAIGHLLADLVEAPWPDDAEPGETMPEYRTRAVQDGDGRWVTPRPRLKK